MTDKICDILGNFHLSVAVPRSWSWTFVWLAKLPSSSCTVRDWCSVCAFVMCPIKIYLSILSIYKPSLKSPWLNSYNFLTCGISLCNIFSARQHIMQSALYIQSPVCLWHGHTGGSVKTVEVKIMQLSPQSSPISLVCTARRYEERGYATLADPIMLSVCSSVHLWRSGRPTVITYM